MVGHIESHLYTQPSPAPFSLDCKGLFIFVFSPLIKLPGTYSSKYVLSEILTKRESMKR